jgi:hypothetical protein
MNTIENEIITRLETQFKKNYNYELDNIDLLNSLFLS